MATRQDTPSRIFLRRARAAAVLATLAVATHRVAAAPVPEAQEGTPPPAAVEAVTATVEVERALLKEDMDRHDRLSSDRPRIAARLAEIYAEVDAAFRRNDPLLGRALEESRAKIEGAEGDRADLLAQETVLLERIQDRLRRIKLLEERLMSLADRVQEIAGPLAGRWEVALLPAEQHGVFSLVQSGTLVTGTYQLEGGWTGSLQGTLVNRKVHLERIDSKLGRSAEFEGFLSSDGSRIRGTWRSYELAAQDPASGQWSAIRRSAGY